MAEPTAHASGPIVTIGSLAVIALTTVWLPERIATHFGANGVPNGFMTRGVYLAFMAAVAVGLPTLVLTAVAAATRRASGSLNIPNRAYWFAPERRGATGDYLVGHLSRLSGGIALFALAFHFLLIRANAQVPPHLEALPFALVLAAGLGAGTIWAATLRRRFRLP